MLAEKKTMLLIEFIEMPKPIMEVVRGWCGFGNDCIVPLRSEFNVKSFAKGMVEIESYWEQQKKTNSYEGTLEQFIKDYGLAFEVWFIEQKFDLTGVDKIAVNVCW